MVYAAPSVSRIQCNGGSAPTQLEGPRPSLRWCRRGRQRRGGTTVSLSVTGRGVSEAGERRGGTASFFWLPPRPQAREGRGAHSPWTSPDTRHFLFLPTSPAVVCTGASPQQPPTARCTRGAPKGAGAVDPPRVGRHVSPHVSGGGHTLGVSATASPPRTVIPATTIAPPLHLWVRACAGRPGYQGRCRWGGPTTVDASSGSRGRAEVSDIAAAVARPR